MSIGRLVLIGILGGLLVVVIFASGCSVPYAKAEAGYGEGLGILDDVHSQPFRVSHFAARVGSPVVVSGRLEVALEAGVSATVPINVGSPSVGPEVALRILFKSDHVQPYVIGTAGAHFFSGPWQTTSDTLEQRTRWGFPLSFGVGLRVPVTDTVAVSVETRFFHESNGAKVFGHTEPNPSFNALTCFLGLEIAF